MARINMQKIKEREGIGIKGEVIGNSKFDCLDIFSKEYAILHAISEIRNSEFSGKWSEY
jgi:hypothetical protein